MASTLDFLRELALVLGTCTGLAARADLALLGNEATQQFSVLVVNDGVLFNTELADLRPRHVAP